MAKISVIVPVYNAEKYLDKCISSLLGQTLRDIELVLVDDGSGDRSGEICDIWAKKDSRVRVIHQKNGGPHAAVMTGVRCASSALIGFCDSDDYVAEDYYETLHRAMEESKADLVCCQLQFVYGEEKTQYCGDQTSRTYSSQELLQEYWESSGDLLAEYSRNLKLFRKCFLMAVLEEINPSQRVGEDAVLVLQYLELCGTACILDRYNGYFYRQVTTSLMNRFCDRQVKDSVQFVKELEIVAEKYHHRFSTRDRINDGLMSNLLYKCAASDLKIAEKVRYAGVIIGEMADKTHFTERYLSHLNPVLQYGFRLMQKGKIKTGMRFSAAYIDFVQRIVGK